MTWKSITEDERRLCRQMRTWIETARKCGGPDYPADWLPSDAYIEKSALFERLRSGKQPLEYPPPIGLACPWYALVEERGPHYICSKHSLARLVWFAKDNPGNIFKFGPDVVSVLNNNYTIVQRRGEEDFIVKDASHDTPYRFRLWYDADHDPIANPGAHTVGRMPKGGWLLQNVVFA